ncbi:hypothetical protein DOTSEDRAFT_166318 [Dothistroma septosporum NZE10]|uniref:Uncharacterized protein n=1 Tax=Dothistroma septosporum (strain NZE10 / CBS 128990) TaxID=675120 RepID=N1PWI1_DOTSN|nr:hypothetical protein DOTSEDRAFT_166318 [Dothistroma septosporum NZE10]
MLNHIVSLIYLCVAAVAADGVQFYGYGSGIKGLPLFYSDGTAYLGRSAPSHAAVATNITLVQNASDKSFTANPTNTSITSAGNWTSPTLFVDNSEGAFAAAGFASVANSSITNTGFEVWGTLLVWISTSGDITTKWYAEPIDSQNLTYVLKWNVDNVWTDTATPVVIKSFRSTKA